jgi:glycosyltransferase involved in cell wall biosynthesis
MKIFIAHNAYQKHGGEDVAVEAEARLLEHNGDTVIRYGRSNEELRGNGALRWLGNGGGAIWSQSSYQTVRKILGEEQPDIAHFHNTFPLISPAAYFACVEGGVPVVQTLHNYRIICPGGQLLRNGEICEECVGKGIPWRGVVHACYRGSTVATAATTAMLAVHSGLGTWQKRVSMYIALSEFARSKFIEGGLPARRIAVKPNFAERGANGKSNIGDYVLYVGRLSHEKGPQLLPAAWRGLKAQIPLHVVGDGPLEQAMRAQVDASLRPLIHLKGRCAPEQVASLMVGARCLVVPSITYENFPLCVVEAYSCGLPVLASRIGSLAEIVRDGVTGLHFEPGNRDDLAAKVEWAWTHPREMAEMGRDARKEFETKYTAQRNYKMLKEIYRRATAVYAETMGARATSSAVRESEEAQALVGSTSRGERMRGDVSQSSAKGT